MMQPHYLFVVNLHYTERGGVSRTDCLYQADKLESTSDSVRGDARGTELRVT